MTSCRARSLRALVSALTLCAAAAVPGRARAEATADERAAAQALFDDARKLLADKRYAEACPKLEESEHLDPGVGTLLNLADCQVHTGKTASAWTNFLEAAYMAKTNGESKRETTARTHAAALEPKLSRITILAVVSSGMVIKRDGAAVAAQLIGTAVPVDPGVHVVSASAPGRQPWESKVTVRSDGHQVTVSVPQLEEEAQARPSSEAKPPPPPPPPAEGTPPSSSAEVKPPPPPPRRPPPDPPGTGLQGGGILFSVLGVGGLGAGATFAALAKQKYSDSNTSGCNPTTNVCTGSGYNLRNTAHAYAEGSVGALIGGGICAAMGIGFLAGAAALDAKAARSPAVTAVVVVTDARGGVTLGLKGSF